MLYINVSCPICNDMVYVYDTISQSAPLTYQIISAFASNKQSHAGIIDRHETASNQRYLKKNSGKELEDRKHLKPQTFGFPMRLIFGTLPKYKIVKNNNLGTSKT